jgi:hypothetical protein
MAVLIKVWELASIGLIMSHTKAAQLSRKSHKGLQNQKNIVIIQFWSME